MNRRNPPQTERQCSECNRPADSITMVFESDRMGRDQIRAVAFCLAHMPPPPTNRERITLETK